MDSFSRKLADIPLSWIGAATILYWFGLSYYTGQARKLKHLPTVGSTWPLLSYLGTLDFVKDSRKVVKNGSSKWPMFKVAHLLEWQVIVTDPTSIEEVRKAADTQLSPFETIDEMLQTKYTLGPQISSNHYHVPIVRAQLTRALPTLALEIHDEVAQAFSEYIPPTDDWTSVKVTEMVMKVVARASNRIFVGLPLCRNPDYLDLNVKFTIDVVQSGAILRVFPDVLRPFVNSWVSTVSKRTRDALGHLAPLIAERRKEREEKGDSYEKPVDFLTWLMDEAKGEETQDEFLTRRILTVNFASIHTTSMTFSHVLYWLAAYPKYLTPLREEIEEVVKHEGWTKEALDHMPKLDSFVKESQRLTPLGILMTSRTAVKDYTFSNGTVIPAGTVILVSNLTHVDRKTYEDPETFDGFRFIKMKQHAEANGHPEKKFDIVSVGVDSLGFGIGRHACPGRFFAANEIKLMLAHLVVNYDVKLENEGVRPPDMWIMTSCVPNPTAEVLFRKRK